MIKTIAKLNENKGLTYDDKPLSAIAKEIEANPGLLEDLKKGKILKIIIEITDGGSSNKEATKKILQYLTRYEEKEGLGVVARAIQIKPEDQEEKKIFKDVWKKNGYPLGDEIYKLPQAVATILAKYIGAVKL